MTAHDPHDPLCGECSPHDHYCHCALIARVRAEYTDWVAPGQHDAVVATAEARARADERERLLAQVARLDLLDIAGSGVRETTLVVRLDDVEALLGGESDG